MLVFNILDLDGDGILSILDLDWLIKNFNQDSPMGQAINEIFEVHMDNNVRPKFIKNKVVIDFNYFSSISPNFPLVKELEYVLI
jgi:hypothetical protein